jgi:glycosyltransferase involved in cell wall biosynthesis
VTIEECLRSLFDQDYPKNVIEVILVDAGSKDATIGIAKAYGVRIVSNSSAGPEEATAIGINHSKSELVLSLASDNILPHRKWLQMMVEPFEREAEIVGAQPWRYTYRSRDSMLDRYFALVGANDPLPLYLGKRDRLSWSEDRWTLAGNLIDRGDYLLLKFEPGNVPTIGANGFMIRRDLISKVTRDTRRFFHIDANLDLITMGYSAYAMVKTDIIHKTGYELTNYFRKRIRYMGLYFRDKSLRRYHLYSEADRERLLEFILLSVTVLQPVKVAIRGYKRVRDSAWFLHPVMCFTTIVSYSI